MLMAIRLVCAFGYFVATQNDLLQLARVASHQHKDPAFSQGEQNTSRKRPTVMPCKRRANPPRRRASGAGFFGLTTGRSLALRKPAFGEQDLRRKCCKARPPEHLVLPNAFPYLLRHGRKTCRLGPVGMCA